MNARQSIKNSFRFVFGGLRYINKGFVTNSCLDIMIPKYVKNNFALFEQPLKRSFLKSFGFVFLSSSFSPSICAFRSRIQVFSCFLLTHFLNYFLFSVNLLITFSVFPIFFFRICNLLDPFLINYVFTKYLSFGVITFERNFRSKFSKC